MYKFNCQNEQIGPFLIKDHDYSCHFGLRICNMVSPKKVMTQIDIKLEKEGKKKEIVE